MMGVHLFAFMTLEDEALQDVKVTRERDRGSQRAAENAM
jgi:hypothetical protein